MLIQTYHKARNLTKEDTAICRFLPEELTELLVPYLAEVRPLETKFSGKDPAGVLASHLFVRSGKVMSAEAIRTTFSQTMAKYGVIVCLSGFRFEKLTFLPPIHPLLRHSTTSFLELS